MISKLHSPQNSNFIIFGINIFLDSYTSQYWILWSSFVHSEKCFTGPRNASNSISIVPHELIWINPWTSYEHLLTQFLKNYNETQTRIYLSLTSGSVLIGLIRNDVVCFAVKSQLLAKKHNFLFFISKWVWVPGSSQRRSRAKTSEKN